MFCPVCGREVPQEARFCGACGTPISSPYSTPVPEESANTYAFTAPPAPVKKRTPFALLLLPLIAIVLVAAVLLGGLVYSGFGTYLGPLGGLRRALYRSATAESASFHIDVETDDEDGTIDGKMVYDLDENDLTIVMSAQNDDENETAAIIDEEYYAFNEESGSSEDISDSIDPIFEFVNVYTAVLHGDEVDWDAHIDDEDSIFHTFDGELKQKDVEVILTNFEERFTDRKWLESELGFEKERSLFNGTTYRFRFTAYELAVILVECLEGAVDDDELDDALDSLRDDREEANAYEMELALTVKNSKIVVVDLIMETDEEDVDLTITFDRVGTTTISPAETEQVVADYEAGLCAECGDDWGYNNGYCYDCAWDILGYCDRCSTFLDADGYCPDCGVYGGSSSYYDDYYDYDFPPVTYY